MLALLADISGIYKSNLRYRFLSLGFCIDILLSFSLSFSKLVSGACAPPQLHAVLIPAPFVFLFTLAPLMRPCLMYMRLITIFLFAKFREQKTNIRGCIIRITLSKPDNSGKPDV
jgi:hypothetical protein